MGGDESYQELRARICEHENSKDILLYVSGKPMGKEGVISSLENCAVDVTSPLLGGKVHGSLARAGKVRGQTPKVEKQEKKKKRTGRLKGEFNTIEDLLMSLLRLEENEDLMQIRKILLVIRSCCFCQLKYNVSTD